MSADEKARWMELLETLCPIDRYKVEIYAAELLKLHGGIAKPPAEE